MELNKKDIFWTIFLILTATFLAILGNPILSSIFIGGVIWSHRKSKSEVPYFAMALFVAGTPAGFMFVQDFYLLPEMPFLVVFSISLFFKYRGVFKKLIVANQFRKSFKYFTIYVGVLIIIGLMLGVNAASDTGFGIVNYVKIIRFVLLLPLVITLPVIFPNIMKIRNALFIVELIVILNIIFQLFYLTTGLHINQIVNISRVSDLDGEGTRAVNGWLYCLVYIMTLVFLRLYNLISPYRWYLGSALTVFSISLGGSRGYLIAVLLILFLSFFILISGKAVFRMLFLSLIVILFLPFLSKVEIINNRVDIYEERFGLNDTSNNDSNEELDVRVDLGRMVIEKFLDSPIIGYGYSADGIEYYDQHTGNQSTLLAGGVVGYFFYVLLLGQIIGVINSSSRYKRKLFSVKLVIGLSLFIIHSTSTDLFSPYFSFETYHYNKMILIAYCFLLFSLDAQGNTLRNINLK